MNQEKFDNRPKEVEVCMFCENPDIQVEMWVDPNSMRIVDSTADTAWCHKCDDHVHTKFIEGDRPISHEKAYDALMAIHGLLDGTEWDSDTTWAIAGMLTAYGLEIRDPNEMEDMSR